MELTTSRLLLREYTAGDFDAVHSFAADPRTLVFVEWGPNSEQDTRDFLDFATMTARATPRTGFTLAITLAGGPVIGSIGLTLRKDKGSTGKVAEVGYTLHPDHWGNGYATEATLAMTAFGFGPLGLDRITATCRPENVASAGVLRKVGMEQVGHLKNDRLIRGRWMDSLVFAVDAPVISPISA